MKESNLCVSELNIINTLLLPRRVWTDLVLEGRETLLPKAPTVAILYFILHILHIIYVLEVMKTDPNSCLV